MDRSMVTLVLHPHTSHIKLLVEADPFRITSMLMEQIIELNMYIPRCRSLSIGQNKTPNTRSNTLRKWDSLLNWPIDGSLGRTKHGNSSINWKIRSWKASENQEITPFWIQKRGPLRNTLFRSRRRILNNVHSKYHIEETHLSKWNPCN